jgi:hypothetical protein
MKPGDMKGRIDDGVFAIVFCMVSGTIKEESGPSLEGSGGTEEEQVAVG